MKSMTVKQLDIFKERYTDPYHFGKIIGDYTITNKIAVIDVKEEYLGDVYIATGKIEKGHNCKEDVVRIYQEKIQRLRERLSLYEDKS